MQFKFNSKTYSLKPSIIPLVAFLLAFAILISLSTWQFKRLIWKNDLISQRISSFELPPINLNKINIPEENEFRKILIKGELLNEFEMFMPALSKRGNNGFHILVPLKTADGNHIIFAQILISA